MIYTTDTFLLPYVHYLHYLAHPICTTCTIQPTISLQWESQKDKRPPPEINALLKKQEPLSKNKNLLSEIHNDGSLQIDNPNGNRSFLKTMELTGNTNQVTSHFLPST